MKFIDEALITVISGGGGNGAIAFRREKFVPRGGPSGGDGGDGGDVVIVADEELSTLMDHAYRKTYRAKRGDHGQGKECTGRRGEDVIIPVPVGTQVFDAESKELISDLAVPGQQFVAAKGGRGGRGNLSFATSVDQAPRVAEEGGPAEKRSLHLVLKLLADVGLLGYPNVGKSTFLSVVSHARPKVADYPFTTLIPQLGVVKLSGRRTFVLSDLPGLVLDAHAGKGLGHRFLKHLERTRVLLHLVTLRWEPHADPVKDWQDLRAELMAFDPKLAEKPEVVALSKLDLPEVLELFPSIEARFASHGVKLYGVSAPSKKGVRQAMEAVWSLLHEKDKEKERAD